MAKVVEFDDAAQPSRARDWQRAEVWATWERMRAGDRREVSKADISVDFDDALRQARARSR